MVISRDEAEAALSEIERTTFRGEALRSYRFAGPILMLWGVIWAIGYVAMGLLPVRQWGFIWLPLDFVGVAATILMSRKAPGGVKGAGGWRALAVILMVGAFSGAVYVVFQPTSPGPFLAFPGLLAGMIYGVFGIWRMTRYIWIGAAVFAATLIGFFCFPVGLAFWMAAAGGGGLILAGLWLRRA